jgi:hypothetical protein
MSLIRQLASSATTNSCQLRPLSVAARFCKVILSFSANFRGKVKYPRLLADSAARLEIPRPAENWALLLSVSSDGPNINKSILRKLNRELTEAKLPLLINIGSCTLHAIHNAFGKYLVAFGSDAEDLVLKLFYWFKHSAGRREDYRFVQIELELNHLFFLRHIPSRWLLLKPALYRTYFESVDGCKNLLHTVDC